MYTTMNSGLSVLHPTLPAVDDALLRERRVAVDPLASPASLKQQAYAALKNAPGRFLFYPPKPIRTKLYRRRRYLIQG